MSQYSRLVQPCHLSCTLTLDAATPGIIDPCGVLETVPAGKYAQETLTSLKLWGTLQPKLVLAKDVRQVLTYVETGNVEAGLVYKSDIISSDKIRIAAVAPDDSHKTIVYPAAVVSGAKNKTAAEEFLRFLSKDETLERFVKYGFKIPKK